MLKKSFCLYLLLCLFLGACSSSSLVDKPSGIPSGSDKALITGLTLQGVTATVIIGDGTIKGDKE